MGRGCRRLLAALQASSPSPQLHQSIDTLGLCLCHVKTPRQQEASSSLPRSRPQDTARQAVCQGQIKGWGGATSRTLVT